MSIVCDPAKSGDGKKLCVKFDDYVKHKFSKKELCWEEDFEVKVWPDCKRLY